MTPENQDSNTEQDLHNLQEKWECVQAKMADRKVSNMEQTKKQKRMSTVHHAASCRVCMYVYISFFPERLSEGAFLIQLKAPQLLVMEATVYQMHRVSHTTEY